MKFKSVILVVTLVSQLCDVYSDDGFLDDFFGRFPHLPFQTLYTVHKNQIRPGNQAFCNGLASFLFSIRLRCCQISFLPFGIQQPAKTKNKIISVCIDQGCRDKIHKENSQTLHLFSTVALLHCRVSSLYPLLEYCMVLKCHLPGLASVTVITLAFGPRIFPWRRQKFFE